MAINTAERRLSTLDMGGIDQVGLPVPSGTVGNPSRLHLNWLYSGIATSGVPVVSTNRHWLFVSVTG